MDSYNWLCYIVLMQIAIIITWGGMAVWDLLHHMEEAIELLRKQMYCAADTKGRLSDDVLTLSQALDRLLNLYERLKVLPRV